jgi:hypothetical protein
MKEIAARQTIADGYAADSPVKTAGGEYPEVDNSGYRLASDKAMKKASFLRACGQTEQGERMAS